MVSLEQRVLPNDSITKAGRLRGEVGVTRGEMLTADQTKETVDKEFLGKDQLKNYRRTLLVEKKLSGDKIIEVNFTARKRKEVQLPKSVTKKKKKGKLSGLSIGQMKVD
ncbi:hypothetical protein QYF36_025461 [Acer negundo]|nr:hypothetical protein QYF36_025461 [Acer negundo]